MKLVYALLFVSTLSAANLSQKELDYALKSAKIDWEVKIDSTVTIELADIGSCDLGGKAAETTTYQVLVQNVVIGHSYTIRLNTNCRWSLFGDGKPLQEVVDHEYGHILGIHEHSKNPHSVMYLGNLKGQRVTEEDRKFVKLSYGARK